MKSKPTIDFDARVNKNVSRFIAMHVISDKYHGIYFANCEPMRSKRVVIVIENVVEC